eukprot:6327555-Amphidinium_carterae.1
MAYSQTPVGDWQQLTHPKSSSVVHCQRGNNSVHGCCCCCLLLRVWISVGIQGSLHSLTLIGGSDLLILVPDAALLPRIWFGWRHAGRAPQLQYPRDQQCCPSPPRLGRLLER